MSPRDYQRPDGNPASGRGSKGRGVVASPAVSSSARTWMSNVMRSVCLRFSRSSTTAVCRPDSVAVSLSTLTRLVAGSRSRIVTSTVRSTSFLSRWKWSSPVGKSTRKTTSAAVAAPTFRTRNGISSFSDILALRGTLPIVSSTSGRPGVNSVRRPDSTTISEATAATAEMTV